MQTYAIMLAASPGSGQALVGLLPFLLIFVVFYFLLILPQQRQRRKTQEMLSNLKTGDRVVTTGGVYGTVAGFRDSVVQLQVTSQVRIDVARTAIAGLQSDGSDGSSKAAESGRKKS
jgi:preprotein translocase subunit YajC